MKDMGESYFVLGIEMHKDRSCNMLGLSQKVYIGRILKRFNMSGCSLNDAPIVRRDKFPKFQCSKKRETMKQNPYASIVGSLIYAQVCTCLM